MSFDQYMIKGDAIQTTFGIIKPDGVRNGGLMAIKLIAERGLVVAATRLIEPTTNVIVEFYWQHKNEPFFNMLIKQMTSGPILCMVITGPNAVARYREILGATDPKKAAPGTLRHLYGTELPNNAFHGSDSTDSAAREISFALRNGML